MGRVIYRHVLAEFCIFHFFIEAERNALRGSLAVLKKSEQSICFSGLSVAFFTRGHLNLNVALKWKGSFEKFYFPRRDLKRKNTRETLSFQRPARASTLKNEVACHR